MTINISWYNDDKTILLIQLDGKWDLAEYLNIIEKSQTMGNEVAHDYVTIADFTDNATPPTKILSAGDRMSNVEGVHLPIVTIIAGLGKLNEMLLSILNKLYPNSVTNPLLAHTFDDALNMAYRELTQSDGLFT